MEIIAKAKAAASLDEKMINTEIAGCLITIHAFPKQSIISGVRTNVLRHHGFGKN